MKFHTQEHVSYKILSEENIYKITGELLRDENDIKAKILHEISNRIINYEPITGYDISLCEGKGNPEYSTLGSIIGYKDTKLEANDIIFEDNTIYLVARNVKNPGIHKISLDKRVLIDIINMTRDGGEKKLDLTIPSTKRIDDFMQENRCKTRNTLEKRSRK